MLAWPDRRPLLALYVAAAEYVTAANPYGWALSPLTATTKQPTAAAYKAYAANVLAIARKVNAQGCIVWDGEGASRYATLGYEGTPANIAAWVSRMAAILRAGGLKVGCTVRHQVIHGNRWYEPWVPGDCTASLIHKLEDAKAKGCGDYAYLDSNSDWYATQAINVAIIKAVHEAHPDVLLVPEHEDEAGEYRQWSMPYRVSTEPRKAVGGEVVAVWVGDDYAKVPDETIQALREDFAAGSIPLLRGWYDSPESRVLVEQKLN